MKRRIALLILILMALSFVACAPGAERLSGDFTRDFNRLDLDLGGRAIVHLMHDPKKDFGWYATGQPKYLKELNIDVVDGELQIDYDRPHDLKLFDFDERGKQNDFVLDVNLPREEFAQLTLEIKGAITLDGQVDFEFAKVHVRGASTIELQRVDDLTATIDGTADLDAASCGNASLNVKGVGNVVLKDIDGGLLDCDVNGAANLELGGQAAAAIININGAAALEAEKLTVGDLDIKMNGVGSATIGRVTGDVTEQVSSQSEIEILERD